MAKNTRNVALYALKNFIARDEQYKDFRSALRSGSSEEMQHALDQVMLTSVKLGNVFILKLALKAGANVQARTENGNTAAHIASSLGNDEAIKLLSEAGFDYEICDGIGRDALYIYCNNVSEENLRKEIKRLEAKISCIKDVLAVRAWEEREARPVLTANSPSVNSVYALV